MTRTVFGWLLLLALLLPIGQASAQPVTDAPTGLAPAPGGVGQEQILEYLRALESLTTEVEFETRGDSRRALNASRIRMTATWERPRNGGPAVLKRAEIKPVAGGRLHFGDEKINKIVINARGEIEIDRKGIDITVSKVTRRANGDLVLDLPWYAFGDKVIPAADVPFALSGWPPTLEDVAAAASSIDPASMTGATQHEGQFSWNLSGRAGATPLPLPGGALEGATSFQVRGAGVLEPDGSFRTLGDGNTAVVELAVGRTHYTRDSGALSADLTGANGRFEGRYGIVVPGGDADGFALEVDGQVGYTMDGRNLRLSLPSGTRLYASHASLTGDGRISGRVTPTSNTMVLRDGSYRLAVDGPLGLNGLRMGTMTVQDLELDGSLVSDGKIEEVSSDRLRTRASWTGELATSKRGAVQVLLDEETEASARIERGSTIRVDLTDATVDLGLPGTAGTNPYRLRARASGELSGTLDLGEAEVRREGEGSMGVTAPRVRTDFDLSVDAGTDGQPDEDYLRDARGTVGVSLPEGGALTWGGDGLPGGPVLSGAAPATTPRPRPTPELEHAVVSGDTINALARRYGVSPERLRAHNGIPAGSALIRVGDRLRIPGSAPAPAAPAPAAPVASAPARPAGSSGGSSRIAPGARLDLDVTSARASRDGVSVEGFVAGRVDLSGAELRAGELQAQILGAARAELGRSAFRLGTGSDGRLRLDVGTIQVPVRIELARGTRVLVTSPGKETDLAFDRDGSYAEFTATVSSTPEGGLKLDELAKVDVLVHGSGVARFGGGVADVPGEKTIRYTGRMALVEGGLDFYGDITVSVRGSEDRPAVRIRW